MAIGSALLVAVGSTASCGNDPVPAAGPVPVGTAPPAPPPGAPLRSTPTTTVRLVDETDATEPAGTTSATEPTGATESTSATERADTAEANETTDATVAVEELADDSLDSVRADVLARISYPWAQRLPGWTVEFLPGRAGYLGATWTSSRRIEIYVRDGQTIDELAFTLAHELGHAVDLTYFDQADRDRWLAARGAPGLAWWTTTGASDYAVGAGDFAEAFAVWQVGGPSASTVSGQPTTEQLQLLAELTELAG